MNVLILSYGKENEIKNSLSFLNELSTHNVLLATVMDYNHSMVKALLKYENFQENKKYKHLFYYFYQDRFINEMSELDGYVSIDNHLEDMWKNFYRVVNFIEEIFMEFKPDIIYSGSPDNYFVNLFIKIAEMKNIKYFWLEQSYFQKDAFTFFSDITYTNDIFRNKNITKSLEVESFFQRDVIKSNPTLFVKSNFKEKIIQNFHYINKLRGLNLIDKFDLMLIPYISLPKNNFKNKFIRLKNRLLNRILLNRHSLSIEDIRLDSKKYKMILLALHYQPEAITLSAQPLFNNQYQLIKLISDILPPGYILLVKEHPLQDIGLRNPYVYKQMIKKRNVKIVKQNISSSYLIENEYIDRVMSIGGTIGFEEILRRKPSMVFSNIYYSNFKYVIKANLETIDTFIEDMHRFLNFEYNDNKTEYEMELKIFLTKYYHSIVKDKSREEAIGYVINNISNYWNKESQIDETI